MYPDGRNRGPGRVAGCLLAAGVAIAALTAGWYLLAASVYAQPSFDVSVAAAFDVDGSGRDVDSIAFWEAPDPADTLMFVTSKGVNLVEVWKYPFDGNSGQPDLEHACIDDGSNGVVVDQETDRLYVIVRSSNNTCVFDLPSLTWLQTMQSDSGYHTEPNAGLLHLDSGQTRLYVSDDDVVYIHDTLSGSQIDKFSPKKGLETMAGDDFYQELYIPDENGGSGVYRYDPDGNQVGSVFGGGVFDSDEEGIIVYTCLSPTQGDYGEGFIVVSDQLQSATEFEFFDRKTKEHLGKMEIGGVKNTDGVGSTQQSSTAFPMGVFAAIDNDSSAAGLGWDTIFAATGLACPPPPAKHTLSYGTVGNGTVGVAPAGGAYDAGTVVTLTAVAAAGWEFDSWSGDLSGNTNPVTLTMDGDKTVTATFSLKQHLLITATVGNGIVTAVPGGGVYGAGTIVSLSAAAEEHWEFAGWSGDVGGNANPILLTMDGDKAVTATFSLKQHRLMTATVGNGNVTIDPGGGVYGAGTVITLTAEAAPYWEFSGWSGDLGGSENPISLTMTADRAVTATFRVRPEDLPFVNYLPGILIR